MKTLAIILFSFWGLFIAAVVLAVRYEWSWLWMLLPIVGILALGALYGQIYKENHENDKD